MTAATSIEDIYPLVPTQQGMLFHTLMSPNSGVYVVQIGFTLKGELDESAFNQAWHLLIERHTVLRTAFAWEGLEQAMQVVGKKVQLPVEKIDLRHLNSTKQQSELTNWLEKDRNRGFNLNTAPLMRITQIQLDENSTRIIWTYHHILLDGWSLPLLLREWVICYQSAISKQQPNLASATPYHDYLNWVTGQDSNEAIAYWRKLLKGFSSTNKLTTKVRSLDKNISIGQSQCFLDAVVTKQIAEFARQERVTLSTVIQAAWSILISRLSGDRDIVFGLARNGRPPSLINFDKRIGLFLNVLPIRTSITGSQSIRSWIQALQEQQVTQQAYEYTALRDVHDAGELPASMPLFDSIVVFENYPRTPDKKFAEGKLQISNIEVGEQTNFVLNLYASIDKETDLKILYDPYLFTAQEISYLLDHLTHIIKSIINSPNALLAELKTISKEEYHRDHVLPNFTAKEFEPLSLFELIDKHVQLRPTQIALQCHEKAFTYEELNLQINRLSNYIISRGVNKQQRIGLCVQRNSDLVVALLAILRCDCSYVPLDPSHPASRLSHIIRDADLKWVISDATSHEVLQSELLDIIDLTQEVETISASSKTAPDRDVSSNDLAYTIYTSGTTGIPKGVNISYANLFNLLVSMGDRIGFTSQNSLLAITTFAFDIATLELLLPLVHGGRTVVANDADVRNANRLAQLIDEYEIDVLQATPATWRLLLELDWSGKSNLIAISGGEAIDLKTAKQLLSRTETLWNAYGPTETTIWSAAVKLEESMFQEMGHAMSAPIGEPLANTVMHVLDKNAHPLPCGFIGELAIGGAGVSCGYHNQTGLTSEKFITNELPDASELPNAPTLYLTGDRVRQRTDGLFEYIGRNDQQIKLRGFRIELGEIESALVSHPAIEQAAVEISNAGSAEAKLVAALCCRTFVEDDKTVMNNLLRDHLTKQLPSYMIPAHIHYLDALPKTENGKLDRRALQQLTIPKQSTHVAPHTPLEKTLSNLWREVLAIDDVGPHDNFFEIGGHSLLLIRAQGLIKQHLDINLELVDLFRYPTPASLAQHIESIRDTNTKNIDQEIQREQQRKLGQSRLAAQRARRKQQHSTEESPLEV